MASHSRKRRRPPAERSGASEPGARSPAAGRAEPSKRQPSADPAGHGARRPASAAARQDPASAATPEPPPLTAEELALLELDPMARRYARSRARDEAVRRGLEPLAPGERPRVVTVAAIVALCFAIANVIATLTVDGLSNSQGDPTTVAIVTTAVLLLAAAGMFAGRYWAVLGFQCILGLQIVVLSLAFTRVQKWWLAIGLVIFIGLLGTLFWKLVRAMARLQMPTRSGGAEPTR